MHRNVRRIIIERKVGLDANYPQLLRDVAVLILAK